MRKPLVWTLAVALVTLACAASACAPAPLPKELQDSRFDDTSVATATPAPTSVETASGDTSAAPAPAPAPSPGTAAGGVIGSSLAAPDGGGSGGDIFRTGMTAAGPVAFRGGDSQVVAPCVQCHGAGGAGGVGPDIRWIDLLHGGYTPATIQRAITKGLNERGRPLAAQMPRFTIGAADMGSLLAYLKILK